MNTINITFHKKTEKPKPGTLCLVFFDRVLRARTCWYLDNTDEDVKEFGDGEGFYRDNEPMSEGAIKLEDIFGWISLKELDNLVKNTKGN